MACCQETFSYICEVAINTKLVKEMILLYSTYWTRNGSLMVPIYRVSFIYQKHLAYLQTLDILCIISWVLQFVVFNEARYRLKSLISFRVNSLALRQS